MIYHPPPKQTVYIVVEWQDSYNIAHISRVFTDKQDAENDCKRRNEDAHWERFTCEPWEVEPGQSFIYA